MMTLHPWHTVLSEASDVYYYGFRDDGDRQWFTVRAVDGEIYEVRIRLEEIAIIINEEHLVDYWNWRDETQATLGWTFQVAPPTLVGAFAGIVQSDDFQQYVVSTLDVCLILLSEHEPEIRIASRPRLKR